MGRKISRLAAGLMRAAILAGALAITMLLVGPPAVATQATVWQEYVVANEVKVDHSVWQQLLDRYLDDQHPSGINRFDYAAVSGEDQIELSAYLDYLQGLAPQQLTRDQQFAYWVNLYNATTVRFILEADRQLESIRQIRSGLFKAGPWQLKVLTVADHKLSLDDIEHTVLRPIWQDQRIHYAVNCASLGCPNLSKTAFTAANIEALLEMAASDFINHPRGVRIADKRLTLSKIYKWYSDDFGDDFNALLAHLSRYAKPPLKKQLAGFKKADYQYDWALNRP